MFACFGKSKKKKGKKNEDESDDEDNKKVKRKNSDDETEEKKELEDELLKLKIEQDNLKYANETYQRECDYLNTLISNCKITLNNINNVNEEEDNNEISKIQKFLNEEQENLQYKIELLKGENKIITSQFEKSYQELERLSNPRYAEKPKLEQKKFIYENILLQKTNELQYLKDKLSQMKKNKKNKDGLLIDDIFLHNNEGNKDDSINDDKLSQYSDESFDDNEREIDVCNISGSDMSSPPKRKTNNFNQPEFPNSDIHKETIKTIIKDNIEFSREGYQKIYKQAVEENTKYNENIKTLNKIKSEIEKLKNPKGNNEELNGITNAQNNKKEEKNIENKKVKEKKDELEKNKKIISDLVKEVDNAKNRNLKSEKEIEELMKELSQKFKQSIELEKELEKAKAVKKKMSTEFKANKKNT